VEVGFLDSPHLAGNPVVRAEIRTRMIDGKCLAVDPGSGRPIPESERIAGVMAGLGK
jgi:hypothetical protein